MSTSAAQADALYREVGTDGSVWTVQDDGGVPAPLGARGRGRRASLVLEVTQYVLAAGSSDITDLVVNTAGGLAGIGLLALARRRLQDRTGTVMTRVCSIGTVLSLLAVGIFVISPLRYAPPRDADVLVVSTPPSLTRVLRQQLRRFGAGLHSRRESSTRLELSGTDHTHLPTTPNNRNDSKSR